MIIRRRAFLASLLFGGGYVGLRALATGLPLSVLLKGPRALAATGDGSGSACADPAKAQFFVLSTSYLGDPFNVNVPGCYADPAIVHPDAVATGVPLIAPTQLTLSGTQYTAPSVWTTLPQQVLDRTCFWHLMTNTPVHPKEQDVLSLNGATAPTEMLPSLLARQLAPCLGTIQDTPVSLGAITPSESLTALGRPLPTIPPSALRAMLTDAADPFKLQALRDQTLEQINDIYRTEATPAQRAYLDSMVASQQEIRALNQGLLAAVADITGNTVADQITAAVALIRIQVSPVIVIHIPFGGDNHDDPLLAGEAAQTVSGVQAIGTLMKTLATAGLQDKVSFLSLNVFGRTLGPHNDTANNVNGRQHNQSHQVSLTIGKPFRGGVIGGVQRQGAGDFGALSIDSMSGAGSAAGDIDPLDALASFGKTVLAAVGGDHSSIVVGKVVQGALA